MYIEVIGWCRVEQDWIMWHRFSIVSLR